MKKLYSTVALLLMALQSDPSAAECTHTHYATMADAIAAVEVAAKGHNPQDILVCFDVDFTLTMPGNINVYPNNLKAHRKTVYKILKPQPKEIRFLAKVLSTKQGKSKLVEGSIPKQVKALQERGFQTMAVTGTMPGKVGNILSIEDHRRDELQAQGISFKDQSSLGRRRIVLTELVSTLKRSPVFKHGILFCNADTKGCAVTKGSALKALVDHMRQKPKVIVLIDDNEKYLASAQEAFENVEGVTFVGIHYTGANAHMEKTTPEAFTAFWKEMVLKAKAAARG